MLKRNSLFVGAVMSVAMALPALAEDETPAQEAPTAETVIATVNGEEITLGHLILARTNLPAQYQTLPDDVLFAGLLEQLIQQTVLGQAMGEASRQIEIRLENERRSLIAGKVMDDVMETAVTEETLQAAYDAQYADAEPTKEFNASHILVETEEQAAALIEELTGGADFAALAQEHSTGPSGPNGGALGWFGPGMMVKPFEDAVLALEAGQISAPVQTQFGWHVVKLNEVRMKGAPPLEEVRAELVEALQQTAVEKALEELMKAATITRITEGEIDPAVVGQFELVE